jgi:hypothetical protein
LYTKGKGNTSIGIVKRILSKDYEDAGYPPPTNVKKQKITQKMGDSEEKNLFAIDKKCREELYNDIPNVLKHVSKANSIDETHSISSDNNSKTITEPSIDTNLTAESISFPVILANKAQFVSFLYEYILLLGCNSKFSSTKGTTESWYTSFLAIHTKTNSVDNILMFNSHQQLRQC